VALQHLRASDLFIGVPARDHGRRRSRRRTVAHRQAHRKIDAVDTLAAGDAFHGGFVLALAEGKDEIEAMRFGSAVAAIKCSRLGGGAGMPTRAEVEGVFAKMDAATA